MREPKKLPMARAKFNERFVELQGALQLYTNLKAPINYQAFAGGDIGYGQDEFAIERALIRTRITKLVKELYS